MKDAKVTIRPLVGDQLRATNEGEVPAEIRDIAGIVPRGVSARKEYHEQRLRKSLGVSRPSGPSVP